MASVLLRDRLAGAGLETHYRELLSILVWKWTEAHGKYRGCRYWSQAALAATKDDWCHEHVVPRRLLVDAVRDLADPSPDAVRDLLERMAVACVVTRAEHDALPEAAWEELLEDPWARYRRAGIEVVDTLQPATRSGR